MRKFSLVSIVGFFLLSSFVLAAPTPSPSVSPRSSVSPAPSMSPFPSASPRLATRVQPPAPKAFDKDFAQNAFDACSNLQHEPPSDYQAWLDSEFKDLGITDAKIEKSKVDRWQIRNFELKADNDSIDGQLHEMSPGTWGTVGKLTIKAGNDQSGHLLSAGLVDAGQIGRASCRERV